MSSRGLAVAAAAALLAGCGESSSIAPSFAPYALSPERVAGGAQAKAPLEIHVRIPRIRHHHSARYLSPATKGMTLALAGHGKTVTLAFGLTPQTDPHCKSSDGTTSCSITVLLPAGRFTANVSTYDKPPAGGKIPSGAHLLSTEGGVPVNVIAGKRVHARFTLEGVPAAFTIGSLPSASANTPFTVPQPFSVQVLDADGYTIVGAYDDAVTLTDSDASGATSIATSGADNPPAGELLSSSDTAALDYNGQAIAPATLSASAQKAATGTATFTPVLQPIGPVSLTGGVAINPYGAATPVTFTASEPGWTNAPYAKPLTATPSSACSSFVTISPSSGTAFAATLTNDPTSTTCTLTLSDGAGQTLAIPLGYQNFAYTGVQQSFTAPAGVTQVTVLAAGAQGGAGNNGSAGGKGGTTSGTIAVLGGASLYIYVGGAGGSGTGTYPYAGSGGYNGGGDGSSGVCGGGGGGGASDVRVGTTVLANRLVVGGAGGGSACGTDGGGAGGAGGSSTFGGSAANGVSAPGNAGVGGGGGTSSLGGTAGGSCLTNPGSAGMLGSGGAGGSSPPSFGAGGGGGGFYGGGGGGTASETMCVGDGSAGGGGGSSFLAAGATQLSTTQGTNAGNGYVTITW